MPHLGRVPPELQFGENPLNPCVGLLVGIPNQLSADGRGADHPLWAKVNPNGNTSYNSVINAALSWASGLRGTYQYPLSKFRVLKYLLLTRVSKD